MFDEHLPSCTDRDLCVRLADVAGFRFASVNVHTVHHYADDRRDRLSTPGADAKTKGLTRFFEKHGPRFDGEARRLAEKRAKELFGWAPGDAAATPSLIADPKEVDQPANLVVGFVTDSSCSVHVARLLEDLLALSVDPGIHEFHVVIVENGPRPIDGSRPLHQMVSQMRQHGLQCEFISIERQRVDADRRAFGAIPMPGESRLPIAISRTMLSFYVGLFCRRVPNSWAWILDDDKRLGPWIDCGDGHRRVRPGPDLAALRRLRDAGVDVVLGPDTDAAPLPFMATLRTQMVDLSHNIVAMLAARPRDRWSGRVGDNIETRRLFRDSHHDLARSTEHLETPFWYRPNNPNATVGIALEEMTNRVSRVLAGEQVFRPLILHSDDLANGSDSVARGGSALFFDPENLLRVPNSIAKVGNSVTRRSDMIVSSIQRSVYGLKVISHGAIAVRHDRSDVQIAPLDFMTLKTDIVGYAISRALDEVLASGDERTSVPKTVSRFQRSDLEHGVVLVRKYLRERLAAFHTNAIRVIGAAESVREQLQRTLKGDAGWAAVSQYHPHLQAIVDFVNEVLGQTDVGRISGFVRSVEESVDDREVRRFFTSIKRQAVEFQRSSRELSADVAQFFEDARIERARSAVDGMAGNSDLTLLGTGKEGVVFSNGERVFKVIELSRIEDDRLQYLESQVDAWKEAESLYSIESIERLAGCVVLTYAFESSAPYAGGYGPAVVEFLQECKHLGIVFRNVHPKNFRVVGRGLKFIDYGRDIRPFSTSDYREMAKRAWLTWRWHHRRDLSEIMMRALVDETLPELDGFERFWTAVQDESPSANQIVCDLLAPHILQSGVSTALDYGCGKGRLANLLYQAGVRVTAFDPDTTLAQRWMSPVHGPCFTNDRETAFSRGPFDAVICSLVLCELADEQEYEAVLRDLRSAVRADGYVYVVVCNPFFIFGGPTPLHRRRYLPAGAQYDGTFEYDETATLGRPLRHERHRSFARLRRDLLRHGLVVTSTVESETVDMERFEPASDFLVLACKPRETPHRCTVDLVIKTCAQEWATIERQVEHLIEQLEHPRVFRERVLAIDSRATEFLRQYAEPDARALRAAGERLLRRGLIDRIHMGPVEAEHACALNRRWFDIDVMGTHASNGGPVATSLSAFESCSSDYVLQVDSDVVICRRDMNHDFLDDMIEAMQSDERAVTVAFNITHDDDRPYTSSNRGVPWRVECRACLFDRKRLLENRPYPNAAEQEQLQLQWHRSMDQAAVAGRVSSLRGGDHRTCFIHPANDLKRDVVDWMFRTDLARQSVIGAQIDSVDLVGDSHAWLPKERGEPFVFVITGHNVPPGRFRRCVDSLIRQNRSDWGAIIVDDGSCDLTRHYLAMFLQPFAGRVTLLQPPLRRGQLANMVSAIRHICTNADSVIVTLDMDDALLGDDVIDRLAEEFESGADVTVGSMLRTDKDCSYAVSFRDPRSNRGGNVWQHLRAFRKSLFDSIPDDALRVKGTYVDMAIDWAFMIPMVELAAHPVWIRRPLYLYETSGMGKGPDRHQREERIARILAKPRLLPPAVMPRIGSKETME